MCLPLFLLRAPLTPIYIGVGSIPSDSACRTFKGIVFLVVMFRMTDFVTWIHAMQEEGWTPRTCSRCHQWFAQNVLLPGRHQPATASVQLGLNILKSATHLERQDSLERFWCSPDVHRCEAHLFPCFKFVLIFDKRSRAFLHQHMETRGAVSPATVPS